MNAYSHLKRLLKQQLTEPERGELQTLVREAEEIMLANARLLGAQRRQLHPLRSHEAGDG